MARKFSIINLSFYLFFVGICSAELPEFQGQRELEESEEASITSGIRTLEKIRREIIDSRNARVALSKESETSGYSKYSGASMMEDNNFSTKSTGSRHPRRQVDLAMYEALSKIAKVQVADSNMEHSGGSYTDEINGRGAAQKFYNPNEEIKKELKNVEERLKKEESVPKTSITSGEILFGQKKFNCRPIQDIYIPKVDKRMPAYLCTLGKRAFVISSERFHQERRNHFEVNVDENTFRRLNPINNEMTTLTSGVSVLPATLLLKPGENGYTVRQLNEAGNSNL